MESKGVLILLALALVTVAASAVHADMQHKPHAQGVLAGKIEADGDDEYYNEDFPSIFMAEEKPNMAEASEGDAMRFKASEEIWPFGKKKKDKEAKAEKSSKSVRFFSKAAPVEWANSEFDSFAACGAFRIDADLSMKVELSVDDALLRIEDFKASKGFEFLSKSKFVSLGIPKLDVVADLVYNDGAVDSKKKGWSIKKDTRKLDFDVKLVDGGDQGTNALSFSWWRAKIINNVGGALVKALNGWVTGMIESALDKAVDNFNAAAREAEENDKTEHTDKPLWEVLGYYSSLIKAEPKPPLFHFTRNPKAKSNRCPPGHFELSYINQDNSFKMNGEMLIPEEPLYHLFSDPMVKQIEKDNKKKSMDISVKTLSMDVFKYSDLAKTMSDIVYGFRADHLHASVEQTNEDVKLNLKAEIDTPLLKALKPVEVPFMNILPRGALEVDGLSISGHVVQSIQKLSSKHVQSRFAVVIDDIDANIKFKEGKLASLLGDVKIEKNVKKAGGKGTVNFNFKNTYVLKKRKNKDDETKVEHVMIPLKHKSYMRIWTSKEGFFRDTNEWCTPKWCEMSRDGDAKTISVSCRKERFDKEAAPGFPVVLKGKCTLKPFKDKEGVLSIFRAKCDESGGGTTFTVEKAGDSFDGKAQCDPDEGYHCFQTSAIKDGTLKSVRWGPWKETLLSESDSEYEWDDAHTTREAHSHLKLHVGKEIEENGSWFQKAATWGARKLLNAEFLCGYINKIVKKSVVDVMPTESMFDNVAISNMLAFSKFKGFEAKVPFHIKQTDAQKGGENVNFKVLPSHLKANEDTIWSPLYMAFMESGLGSDMSALLHILGDRSELGFTDTQSGAWEHPLPGKDGKPIKLKSKEALKLHLDDLKPVTKDGQLRLMTRDYLTVDIKALLHKTFVWLTAAEVIECHDKTVVEKVHKAHNAAKKRERELSSVEWV
jgi:hypothetical protein